MSCRYFSSRSRTVDNKKGHHILYLEGGRGIQTVQIALTMLHHGDGDDFAAFCSVEVVDAPSDPWDERLMSGHSWPS